MWAAKQGKRRQESCSRPGETTCGDLAQLSLTQALPWGGGERERKQGGGRDDRAEVGGGEVRVEAPSSFCLSPLVQKGPPARSRPKGREERDVQP